VTESIMSGRQTRTAELRQKLSTRRREVQHEVRARIRDGRVDRRTEPREDLERCDDDIQGNIEFALLQMRAESIGRFDQALDRLDAGQYGTCLECGSGIAKPRLRALPFAVRCRTCEERREQEHGQAREPNRVCELPWST